MFRDIRLTFYGATTYLSSLIISAVSVSRISHSGIQFTSDSDFVVKGTVYPAGTYVTHATESSNFRGVLIEPVALTEGYYRFISKYAVKGVEESIMSNRLEELMTHWAYTDYSMISLLNPFYWQVENPTIGVGVICTTYQLVYLQSFLSGYMRIQVISPAKLNGIFESDTDHFKQVLYYSEPDINHTIGVLSIYMLVFFVVVMLSLVYNYLKFKVIYNGMYY